MADEDLHNPFISFAKEVKDGLVLHAKVPCFLWLDVNGLTCIDYETRQVTHNAPLESVTNVRQDGDKLRCHLTWDGAPKEKVFVVGKVVATAFYQRLGQLQAAAQDTEHLAKLRKEAIHVPIGASPAAKYLDGVEENAPSITRSANSASDKKEGLKALQIPSSTGRSITESPDFPFSPSRPETPDKQKVAKPKKKLVTRMGGADTNVAEMELSQGSPSHPTPPVFQPSMLAFPCRLIEETETGREMREVMLIIHNEGLYVVKEGPGQKYSQRKVVYISYRDISKSRVVWNEDEFRVTVKKRAGTSVCYKFETPQVGDPLTKCVGREKGGMTVTGVAGMLVSSGVVVCMHFLLSWRFCRQG
eukprot:jgi/Mesvir1/1114/Mv17621-RA.1